MGKTTLYIHRFRASDGISVAVFDMERVNPDAYVLVKIVEVDLGEIPEIDWDAEIEKEKARKIAHYKAELAKMGVEV